MMSVASRAACSSLPVGWEVDMAARACTGAASGAKFEAGVAGTCLTRRVESTAHGRSSFRPSNVTRAGLVRRTRRSGSRDSSKELEGAH